MLPDSQDANAIKPAPRPVPERFIVSPGTLRLDRFMSSAIIFGGIGIIVAVFGIFAFILLEIVPLFQSAKIEPKMTVPLSAPQGAIVGLDEWSELPFRYSGGGEITFVPADGSAATSLPLNLPADVKVTASQYDAQRRRILLGTGDGRVGFAALAFQPRHDGPNKTPKPSVTVDPLQPLRETAPAGPIQVLAYADSGDRKLWAAIQETEGGGKTISTMLLRQRKTLMGKGTLTVDRRDDLAVLLQGVTPVELLALGTADGLIAITDQGEALYLSLGGGGWELRQRFRPFKDSKLAGAQFLFGDVSLVTYDDKGKVHIFSLFIPEGAQARVFGLTKHLQPLKGAITYYQASQRNKTFLVGNEKEAALCYATTASVRKRLELPFEAVTAAVDAKAEHIGLLDRQGGLHLYEVRDPHPEAGWAAFFGKVWYEGYNEPRFEWQSTGGTDDFEPKLSLVPLIAGSLKGTLYAMLFSIPIALLAAIYTAQFLPPAFKRVIKPGMEIMASIPSVVLGFLAALWLAPVLESRIPSVLLVLLSIPVSAVTFGMIWGRLPIVWRNRLPKGAEYALIAPVIALLALAGWQLGPALERLLFVATMGDGTQIADFRLWWPQVTNLPYDQRNCVVVGFMMGFAVIPVIFTIAEDALANVPPSLTSASEALGASRWQVVRTVVLPVAAAGMFSAVMIGLGRAVGETMVMVMATGNTPVFDAAGNFVFGQHWNPFNGMRTLSANIAVELPEAVQGSTHYRTLFLGALVLFLMTFVLNTAAELLRQKLRERFKIV